MVYMYVLKCFWADAALIAYRLINMVLSFVLNNKTSFSVLYPEKQLFDLPQKVFEYTCFVQILEKRHHKLDPRANQCVFLEYFLGTKRISMLKFRQQKKNVICADVTFFENIPYFHPIWVPLQLIRRSLMLLFLYR